MAKIIALCGKICSGKSTYAEKIRSEYDAVVLNAVILMLTIFDEHLGDKHDKVDKKVTRYFYLMAENIINANTNVILDFGFWTYKSREETRWYFKNKNIGIEFHYVNTQISTIRQHIEKRNTARDALSYYIDENILNKCLNMFDEPNDSETDFVIEYPV